MTQPGNSAASVEWLHEDVKLKYTNGILLRAVWINKKFNWGPLKNFIRTLQAEGAVETEC